MISLIAAAAACLPGLSRAFAEDPPETGTRSVSVSLDGSTDRYGESTNEELRAGLELECASELKLGRSVLDWNLEVYYDYSRSRTDGAVSNASSVGLDLAKILLTRWRGKKLKSVKPYLLAGAELTFLKEPDEEEGGTISSSFISPTAGFGLELKLNRRISINAEYRQNLSSGARRVSGTTLGLNYAIFGGEDEEDDN